MANIYQFDDIRPVIHESAFIHPQAVVVGNVTVGPGVYIGPCAVLRGDFGEIVIGEGSNVQENCTVHMFPGALARIGSGVTIGHGAVIHGADIGDDVLVDWRTDSAIAHRWRVVELAGPELTQRTVLAEPQEKRWTDVGAAALPGIRFYRVEGTHDCP